MSILDLFSEMAEDYQLGWHYLNSTKLELQLLTGSAAFKYDEERRLLFLSYASEFRVMRSKLSRLYDVLNFLNNQYSDLTFVYDTDTQYLYCQCVIRIRRKKFHKDFNRAQEALSSLIECWEEYEPLIKQALKRRHRPLAEVLVSKVSNEVYVSHSGATLH
jgi:hypothetical protein